MAENIAGSIAKEPVANAEDKARDTTDSLPPITKEPSATATASMMPSVPVQATSKEDAPAAASSDAATKPEESAPAAEAQKDSTKEASKSDAADLQAEKPSDPVPAPGPQSAATETVTSGSVSAGQGDVVQPPKPVSVEEIRDEELPDAKPLEPLKPAEEASKTDSPPAENGDIAAGNKRKTDATEDAAKPDTNSVENGANGDAEPPEKKLKTNGTATNGAPRKPGRPRKDKTAVAPVGRTARKTRSQGAAD
ncbi:hypothetical protein F5Y01DRAFT_283737 [Xylaria sp. FL0043]|nr:hypothetical protein F5Y01DRAFT_283737 [Xylaria sp. FL0043]